MMNSEISLKNKLAFASADVFGGGGFNIINFLFTAFLSLVVGIPMIWVSAILLLTKLWDGVVDPFIGAVTDGKQPGKYGKRRYFMLIFAPVMFVAFVLLFFPWNIVTTSLALKIVLVIFVYLLYATAQSFILIPYYSLSSEMTDDFTQRNKVAAMRIVFSVLSSLVCVSVPGMIATPTRGDGGLCYLLMASIFGGLFCISVLITALFAKEQVITPAIKRKITFKEFFKPLKMKTYRRYLGMQICVSMAMAIISSFFFIFCDFYLRQDTYLLATITASSRFPVATLAAAAMFLVQVIALPFYLWIIRKKSKQFAYNLSATLWIMVLVLIIFLPAEIPQTAIMAKSGIITTTGVPDWLVIGLGCLMGFALAGCIYVPHSSVGDVCNAGELYFGNRTEGAFSGLTNFLNTTAQAIGLAIPPFIMSFCGYVETQYVSLEVYQQNQAFYDEQFKATIGQNVQLVPLYQNENAQLALRLTITLLPIIILIVAILICRKYKISKEVQSRIVELNSNKQVSDYQEKRNEILKTLDEEV